MPNRVRCRASDAREMLIVCVCVGGGTMPNKRKSDEELSIFTRVELFKDL